MKPMIKKILSNPKLPLVGVFLDENAQQMAIGIVRIPDKDTKILSRPTISSCIYSV